MNTFELAGEAMLQQHEGNRLIAQAVAAAFRRFARAIVTALATGPGVSPSV